MLNYMSGGCKGPAKGRDGFPKEIFTKTLGVHRRELCPSQYHWLNGLAWAKAELDNWASNVALMQYHPF